MVKKRSSSRALVEAVRRDGDSREQAEEVVTRVFGAVENLVRNGQPVIVPGFGRFLMKDRKGRTVKSPFNGTVTEIPARSEIGFKPHG